MKRKRVEREPEESTGLAKGEPSTKRCAGDKQGDAPVKSVVKALFQRGCACPPRSPSRLFVKMVHLKCPETLFYRIPRELVQVILDYAFPKPVHAWCHLYWYGCNDEPPYNRTVVLGEMCQERLVDILCYMDIKHMTQIGCSGILLSEEDEASKSFLEFWKGLNRDSNYEGWYIDRKKVWKSERRVFLERREEVVGQYKACVEGLVPFVRATMLERGKHDLAGNQTLMLKVQEPPDSTQ